MKAGDLGFIDPAYCAIQAAKIKRITHSWFRVKISGQEHIPNRNFIAVGNHSGATMIPDSFAWLSEYHTSNPRSTLLSLTNPAAFKFYPRKIANALAKMGAVRAEPRIALAALEQGYSLQIYPGGDFDACRSFVRRNKITFAQNIAYAKLAIKTQTPVLPVLSFGGHNGLIIISDGARVAKALSLDKKYGLKTFPLSLCFPWGLWWGPIPGYLPLPCKIAIEVLPPVPPEGRPEELDKRIREAMQSRLNALVDENRLKLFDKISKRRRVRDL